LWECTVEAWEKRKLSDELIRHTENAFFLAHMFVDIREEIIESAGTLTSLFKKIDFEELLKKSSSIHDSIKEKAKEISSLHYKVKSGADGEEINFYNHLDRYIQSLLNASRILRDKMHILNERAHSRRKLSWEDFASTTKEERLSLELCQQTGDLLTELYHK
jgi:hypothetical protein